MQNMPNLSSETAEPAADALPRRERKRREVRDRLYEAAVSLFTEQGFEETTMEAIGERADVARATVFNHFAQKVAFLEEWGRRRREHVFEVLGAGNVEHEPVSTQLRRYLGELVELNVSTRPETRVLMNASWRFGAVLQDPALGHELAKIVALGCSRGEIRDVDPEQTGVLLSAGYFTTVLQWIACEPAPFSLTEHIEHMLDIVLRGIVTDA
jgi:AcrR family transcriptional regulator